MLVKPAFGDSCNGCGHCCKTQACEMSLSLLKSNKAPCIALEEEGGRYWCGLIRNPQKYMEIPQGLAKSIISAFVTMRVHIGDGCDDNSEML